MSNVSVVSRAFQASIAQPLAWPKPHTVHMDFFVGGFVINPTKAILGPSTKVVLWCSAGVTICPDHFGEYNFGKIAREIFADEERRAGRSLEEILGDVVVAWNGSDKLDGRVVDLVGALQIYDYERNAQGAGGPRQIAPVWAAAQELAAVADALLCPASSALEPLGAPYCRQYYESRGKELFLVGPQMNDKEWEVSVVGTGPSELRVKTFLDDSLAKYGPKSVMYISFGSLFFPVATPHLVETMIQVLLDLEPPIPFMLVLGGAMATLPDETIERVHSSGRGLVCDFWVDQKAILKSGAVGWFLTHGGYNSLTESLSQGIPLIFWPIAGEQATNAAMFSTGSNPIGIELFQIRTGTQLRPSLRSDAPKITGTMEDARAEFEMTFRSLKGPKAAALIRNAARIAELWRAERIDGEPAREINRLTAFGGGGGYVSAGKTFIA